MEKSSWLFQAKDFIPVYGYFSYLKRNNLKFTGFTHDYAIPNLQFKSKSYIVYPTNKNKLNLVANLPIKQLGIRKVILDTYELAILIILVLLFINLFNIKI